MQQGKWKWMVAGAFCALTLVEGAGPVACAQEAIPLSASFSPSEQVLTWSSVGSALVLYLGQEWVVETLAPVPRIAGPMSWELAVTEALYQGPGTRLLGGTPDVVGNYVAPAAALLYYSSAGLTTALAGRSWTGNPNGQHEFLAFAQAYGLNIALTQAAKLFVGRERPLYSLNREPDRPRDEEANLSFWSGHASSSFCLAAYVARDLGDALVAGPLAEAGTSRRVLLGRILPGSVLYGAAALIGLSRVVDQKHWASDVLTGALIGATLGNVVYARHFDGLGRPRVRTENSGAAASLHSAVPATFSFGGTF